MQNGEFTCSLSKPQMESLGMKNFSHVTFAEDSCLERPFHILKIMSPPKVKETVGLCPKIIYGEIDPQKLVEWFEYIKVMGVTKVFAYNSEISYDAQKVLDYYKRTGFLETHRIHPATSEGENVYFISLVLFLYFKCLLKPTLVTKEVLKRLSNNFFLLTGYRVFILNS